MNNKSIGFAGSSVDPSKVSMTVTGAITFSSAIIIGVLAHYGIKVTDSQVAELAVQAGKAVGEILIAIGLLRKLIVFISKVVHGDKE